MWGFCGLFQGTFQCLYKFQSIQGLSVWPSHCFELGNCRDNTAKVEKVMKQCSSCILAPESAWGSVQGGCSSVDTCGKSHPGSIMLVLGFLNSCGFNSLFTALNHRIFLLHNKKVSGAALEILPSGWVLTIPVLSLQADTALNRATQSA